MAAKALRMSLKSSLAWPSAAAPLRCLIASSARSSSFDSEVPSPGRAAGSCGVSRGAASRRRGHRAGCRRGAAVGHAGVVDEEHAERVGRVGAAVA